MNCGISLVKYLLFIFNCIFALLGLITTSFGIWTYVAYGDLSSIYKFALLLQGLFIVLGTIIFVFAFFGCCGAIRENNCMIITFAVLLLAALIIQISIGVWIFVCGININAQELATDYQKIFDAYWNEKPAQIAVDFIQRSVSCCGVNSYIDFDKLGNGTIPWSCCGNELNHFCTKDNVYQSGCVTALTSIFQTFAEIISGISISVAVIEVIGITLSFCLANSLNDDRRGHRF